MDTDNKSKENNEQLAGSVDAPLDFDQTGTLPKLVEQEGGVLVAAETAPEPVNVSVPEPVVETEQPAVAETAVAAGPVETAAVVEVSPVEAFFGSVTDAAVEPQAEATVVPAQPEEAAQELVPQEESVPAEPLPDSMTAAEPPAEEVQMEPPAEAAAEVKRHIDLRSILGIAFIVFAVFISAWAVYTISVAKRVETLSEGIPWYETYTPVEQALPTITFFEDEFDASTSVYSRFSYGNSRTLYAMDAPVTEDKSYYYIQDFTEAGTLVRIAKAAGNQKEPLCELVPECLNLSAGRLYFLGAYPGKEESSAGIYSITTDGEELQLIKAGHFYSLRMVGDWLYYISSGDGCIHKMNIYERHEYTLSKEDCNDFLIEGNTIYYISHDKTLSQNAATCIESMDVNGNKQEALTDYGSFGDISMDGGILYYTIYNEGYGWIDFNPQPTPTVDEKKKDKDKEEEEAEPERPHGFVQITGFYSAPVFYNGEMWFIDRKEMRKLAVYNPESGQLRHYGIENVTAFYILDDVLIVRWLKDGVEPKVSCNRIGTGEMFAIFGPAKEVVSDGAE